MDEIARFIFTAVVFHLCVVSPPPPSKGSFEIKIQICLKTYLFSGFFKIIFYNISHKLSFVAW